MPYGTSRVSATARSLRLLFTVVLFLTVAITTAAITQQTPTIASIEFVGLQRLKADQMIALSGLRVGQPFDEAAVNAAGQKLADTGLFKDIGYRTRRDGNTITIRFEVEETRMGNSPVVFDNFIWFSDEQLTEGVQREVPAFDGTAPEAGDMTNSISIALQKLLRSHNLEGTVEYLPQEAVGSALVFSVTGVKIPVCTIHFPGAQNVPEATLVKNSQELIANDYSQTFSRLFAQRTLGALYREVGQLRAAFGRPFGKPATDPECKGGVDLTISVEEGVIYSWRSLTGLRIK